MTFRKTIYRLIATIAVMGILSAYSFAEQSEICTGGEALKSDEAQKAVKEVLAVKEALAKYFAENDSYPENLDVLVESYGLKRESTKDMAYSPTLENGSYRLCHPIGGSLVGTMSPPFSQRSDRAKLISLQRELRAHYTLNGQYPRDLYEFSRNSAEAYLQEIKEGKKKQGQVLQCHIWV